MSLFQNTENKIKLVLITLVAVIVANLIITAMTFVFATSQISKANQRIYVLDSNVPLIARKSTVEDNRLVEYKSHIELFHRHFFGLIPDRSQIDESMEKALSLIDESGRKEFRKLQENNYFNQIISYSATSYVKADSIKIDRDGNWKYWGTQTVDRPTIKSIRRIVTSGKITDSIRSLYNPHGALIVDWVTLEHSEQRKITKRDL